MGSRFQWGVLIALLVLFTYVTYAQIRSGTITGEVKDASGALIAGAQVVVTNQETSVADSTKTTAAGVFTVPYLPAGTYTVAVTAPGFADYRQTGVVLATAQTVRVNVGMQLATISTAVEVTAQTAQIQTENTTLQSAIRSEMIGVLPNPTSNPMFYAFLQPGVVARSGGLNTTNTGSFGIGVSGRTQWSAMGVNGGRASTNEFQLDGLPVMGGGYNEVAVTPNTEGLEEVRVIANNFTAEYGHGQAVISMSTRSGTNQYHGEANYTLRNEALMANSMSNKSNAVARAPFKVNEFGGSAGGPIIKDKLFFFSSYHFLRFNRGSQSLLTVPTAAEALGDFSKTFIRDEAGLPVPAQIYDPFNVTQLGPDLYERALIPGANLSARPGAEYAKLWFSYYPQPNRKPDDEFNTNNFEATVIQKIRRHNLNNRIDYRRGKHSIYGSGGITKSSNVTPRPFGKAPLNSDPRTNADRNPYGQIGDTIVLTPTLILDMRYGISRIVTFNYGGNKSGWDDALYDKFGLPKNIRPLFAFFGAAPVLNISNYATLTDGLFASSHEGQSMHTGTFSLTNVRGSWTHKFGLEARNLLSNYDDFEEATTQYQGMWFDQGGNFNFRYVTASGGSSALNTTNVQRGLGQARPFLGAPGWWIRPGTNVQEAFSQKYMAFYTQNDWRATSRLTINLGLRWDLQPGPTERHNRMSSLDLTATNPFGTKGFIAMPGLGGYSRGLWDTKYRDFGPRLGAAYQLSDSLVLRGGFGITYLPSNSGNWSSMVEYGASTFSSGTIQRPYGPNPNGVPAIRMTDPAYLDPATMNDIAAPNLYGQKNESKFDRRFQNGRAKQVNFFIEKRFAGGWLGSVGYSGSYSDHLLWRYWPLDSMQMIPSTLRAQWAAEYIASSLKTNPAEAQIPNPYQPAGGPLLNFQGVMGASTIARRYIYYTYPLLAGQAVNLSNTWSRYNSMQVRATHAFSRGFLLDFHYTWAKGTNNTNPTVDQNNPGGNDYYNMKNNVHLDSYDIKHRGVATFLYDFPFGSGKAFDTSNRVARALIGGWQVGGTLTAQTGMPFFISGASDGAVVARPDRISGVPVEVPAALQHWYDGNTTVTLPNGRIIRPSKNTFLKYYSGAFQGRVIKLPNGSYGADQNWFGTSATAWETMRGPGRFNIDLTLRRSVRLTERFSVEVSAEAANLLNNVQLNGNYSGSLGSTIVAANASRGLLPGMGSSDTFGTIGNGTFPPREVVMKARIRF
ncbi:MAG: TonB-dependent receptor domain-containing protein [Bryobacteraceae bacterium]